MMNVNFSFEAIKYNIIKFERFISMFNSFNNSFKQTKKTKVQGVPNTLILIE